MLQHFAITEEPVEETSAAPSSRLSPLIALIHSLPDCGNTPQRDDSGGTPRRPSTLDDLLRVFAISASTLHNEAHGTSKSALCRQRGRLLGALAAHGECLRPQSVPQRRLYELQPALEAPLLRRLFYPNEFYVPPSSSACARGVDPPHPPPARFSLSEADRQALTHFFPAHHCDQLYTTVEDFVVHCRGEAHMFFCEGLPLTPLGAAAVKPQPARLSGIMARRPTRSRLPCESRTDAFYTRYGLVHSTARTFLFDHLPQMSTPRREALAWCLADSLSSAVAAVMEQRRGGHTGDVVGSWTTVPAVCTFLAETVKAWWHGHVGAPSDSAEGVVPDAQLRQSLLRAYHDDEESVQTRLLAPLCLDIAMRLVSVERHAEVSRVFDDCVAQRHQMSGITTPSRKRPRDCASAGVADADTGTGGTVPFFDLLLSLVLGDPAHRTPMVA